jgi:hypothetical protein
MSIITFEPNPTCPSHLLDIIHQVLGMDKEPTAHGSGSQDCMPPCNIEGFLPVDNRGSNFALFKPSVKPLCDASSGSYFE